MPRKLLLVLGVLSVFAASFAVASYAHDALRSSTKSGLPSNLPIASQAPVSVSSDQAAAISNAIPADLQSEFGIDTTSFQEIRSFRDASQQTVYLVPGANGSCLVWGVASTCGDPGASDHILTLIHIDGSGAVSGVGVADNSVHSLRESYGSAHLNVGVGSDGTFAFGAKAGLHGKPSNQPLSSSVSLN